jgi:hypothetical protein
MIAFLKRRWILLSCVVVLLACSMVEWHLQVGNAQTAEYFFGVGNGNIRLIVACNRNISWTTGAMHLPMIGREPKFMWLDDLKWIKLPLWLPLSAVLGWIVFQELRWREKRAKLAEASPIQ